MPFKRGIGTRSPESTAVTVSVAVGLGVAAVAGIAAGAAIGTGVLAVGAANTLRGGKPALRRQDILWDQEGRILNWDQVLKIVQQGGIAPNLRSEIWPFLLGVYSPDSTADRRAAELLRLRSLYIRLVLVCQELDAQRESAATRSADSTSEIAGNVAAFSEAHRIIVMDAVRTDMRVQPSDLESPFWGGVSRNGFGYGRAANSSSSPASSSFSSVPTVTVMPVSVGDGLPELMLVDPPQPEPAEAVANGQLPVWRSKLAVVTIDAAAHAAQPVRRLMMRLVNVLSAYAVHDPESGYCQGMSDLASVFVQIMADDAVAFGCFERLMRDARQNFRHDEAGIKQQLHRVSRLIADMDPKLHAKLDTLGAADCTFAYRMVVVMLRRELSMQEALTLWEVKWAAEAEIVAKAQQQSMIVRSVTSSSDAFASAGSGGSLIVGPSSSASSGAIGLAATVARMDAAARDAVASTSNTVSDNNNTNGRVTSSRPSSRTFTHGSLGLRKSGSVGSSVSSGDTSPMASSVGLGIRRAGSTGPSSLSISSAAAAMQPPPPPDFILQFVVAAVRAQRGKILTDCDDTDGILRLFNSVKIDFWPTLTQARKQHKAYTQGIAVLKRL